MADTEVSVEVMCPLCSELYEVKDPRIVLLAQHIANECIETIGLLHE